MKNQIRAKIAAVIFGVLLACTGSLTAQELPVPGSSATQETQSLKKPFTIKPVTGLELPKGTAAVFASRIVDQPEGLTQDPNGVDFNGYIGYVPYQGKNLVVTVIESVSRGGHTVSIPGRIEAQHYADQLSISSSDRLKLEADPGDIDAALQQLAAMEAKTRQGEEQNPPGPGSAGPSGSSGRGSSGNSPADHYRSPQQQDYASPKFEAKTSRDGCSVRIDNAQDIVIQQSKSQTFEDGKLKTESKCTDSEIRYPLQKTFEGCSDLVNLPALTVYRQSRTYYNKDGSPVPVKGCAKDPGSTFVITEDTTVCAPVVNRPARQIKAYARLVYTNSSNARITVSGCSESKTQPAYALQKSYDSCTDKVDLNAKLASARYRDYYVDKMAKHTAVSDCTVDTRKQWPIREVKGSCIDFLDFNARKAFRQAVMQYTNDKGVVTEARGCDRSTIIKPVPITQDVANCILHHDFDNRQSHQKAMWTYTLDKITYRASACANTEVVYRHTDYTVDASGDNICTPRVDPTTKQVTLYYRTGITVQDKIQYITECKPDTRNTLTIVATSDGCSDPASWKHDLAGGMSYDSERWYYTLNGARQYITSCQPGREKYTHDVTTGGWEYHDDKLYAFPRSTVTITLPTGKYVVSGLTVLPGETRQPYGYQDTVNEISDVSAPPLSYEGCTVAFLKTDRIKRYLRPDGTLYKELVGAGKPFKKNTEYCKTVYYGDERHEIRVGTSSSPCDPTRWETGIVTTTEGHYDWQKHNRVHTVTGKIIIRGDEIIVRTGPKTTSSSDNCRNEP